MAKAGTSKGKMVSKAGLKTRGWAEAGITKFLGEPDETTPNPRYASAAPMAVHVGAVGAPRPMRRPRPPITMRFGGSASSIATARSFKPRLGGSAPAMAKVKEVRRRPVGPRLCQTASTSTGSANGSAGPGPRR